VNTLVTGGSGYFGSRLAERLLPVADHVRVLDVDPAGTQLEDVELIVADIRDDAAVRAATAGIDVVYHCVAQVPLSRDPTALRSVNVDGTATLLRACRDAGVGKVIHLSSSAVFGVPESNPVLREAVPRPQEPYGVAKQAAEWACLHAATEGLDVTIVRPRTILGHGRLGIFAVLFDWIADGADPLVLGTGSNRHQFLHADDLATLCIAAAARPGPAIYNAGTDRFGTIHEAIQHVCTHAGTGARVRSLPVHPAEAAMRVTSRLGLTPFAQYHWLMYGQSMWFDITHARDELGWWPRYSNDEMLAESYDWYRAHRGAIRERNSGSPHRRTVESRLLSALKRLTRALPG
jgi:nucleoside-diphosphate-sugar epimerase